MTEMWVIGSGGHAKVAIDTARQMHNISVCGALDDNPRAIGQYVAGVEVMGQVNLESVHRFGIELAFIAIGSNEVRRRIASLMDGAVSWATLIHPLTYVSAASHIGDGTLVCAGSIVQADAMVGHHVVVNTSSSVDHNCVVQDFAHIAPGAHLAGDVTIGEGALIGLSAGVIQGKRVGDWAIVGAGAMVIGDVRPRTTVVGIPAVELRR